MNLHNKHIHNIPFCMRLTHTDTERDLESEIGIRKRNIAYVRSRHQRNFHTQHALAYKANIITCGKSLVVLLMFVG